MVLIKNVAIYFNKESQEHHGAEMASKLTEKYTACSLIFEFWWGRILREKQNEMKNSGFLRKKDGMPMIVNIC